jgi:hypothetical protein
MAIAGRDSTKFKNTLVKEYKLQLNDLIDYSISFVISCYGNQL